jgi:hypothetical protein
MRHTIAMIVVLATVGGRPLVTTGQGAQPAGPPPKASSDNRLTTLAGFTVDYPKKDWQLLGGTGSSVVVFLHKSREATVAIERTKIEHPLAPNEIVAQTATLEIEDWQARRPLSAGFSHQLLDAPAGRFILIDFSQPGPAGPELVRLYTMPRGNDWFRVVCTTTERAFEKHQATCHRIAQSLTKTTP